MKNDMKKLIKNQKSKIKNLLLVVVLFASCNDFLDTPPDKRAELNSEIKIAQILVSAYPATLPVMVFEMMSDNVSDNGPQYSDNYNAQLNEQAYRYEDITEPYWDAPKTIWESCYEAIAAANHALKAIEEMGNPSSLKGSKAEALLCRAFGHFILVNTFCKAYNPVSSNNDPGIPYVEVPETTVNPKYERGKVSSVYEKINRDIEEALPLHVDKFLRPAYHFNRKAAYAFAARFNLFYGEWSKAAEYASVALGDNPGAMFRDYVALSMLPETENIKYAYCSSEAPCNFLIIPQTGTLWGRSYPYNRRHAHNRNKAGETFWQYFPWGGIVTGLNSVWGNDQNVFFPKIMEFFEITNPTAGIGYPHTVAIPFTVEETLACRAEAYAMTGNFDSAVADLNIFYDRWDERQRQFSLTQISNYYKPQTGSPYIKIESRFNIQPGVQENLVRAVLAVRRFESVHTGQRWLDIKRHGITVKHPQMLSQTVAGDTLVVKPYDNLTAIQLPAEVISAGLPGNRK